MADWAVPAALDTAGNVDKSAIRGNHFEDIDGKCMDLDGFHDGEIRDNAVHQPRNRTTNIPMRSSASSSITRIPDMQAVECIDHRQCDRWRGLRRSVSDGLGPGRTGNRSVGFNRDRCADDMHPAALRLRRRRRRPCCAPASTWFRGAARPAKTMHNRITGNEVSGFGMREHCVAAAPGVSLQANTIAGNRCLDTSAASVEK